MPARALLVLLVMLNFGVATWWLLRPAPSAPATWAQPADVPRLQLLGEQAAARTDATAPVPGTDSVDGAGVAGAATDPSATPDADASTGLAEAVPAPAAPSGVATQGAGGIPATASASAALRCLSFGPFADAAAVVAARSALQPLGATRMRVRDVVDAPRGWRVVMPPQPDRAAADALAAKIRDAGFDDLLVVPSGDEANGIALGRYGSEPSARRRESALREAGFPAQAQPLGDAVTRHWLDVGAGPGFDAAGARGAIGAVEIRDIDCAGIVGTGATR